MKFLFLLVVVFIAVDGYASKTYDFELNLRCILDDLPVKNCEVTIRNDKNTVLTNKSDEYGNVRFEKIDFDEIIIDVIDPSGYYSPKHYWTYRVKNQDVFLTLKLYPSQKYEDAIIEKEDSLYGKENEYLTMFEEFGNKLDNQEYCDSIHSVIPVFGDKTSTSMQRFIQENISYPQESIELNEQGKVYLTFILEKDGTVSHIRVVRGVSQALDFEARRVLRKMPKWKPGLCNGETVRTKMFLPINFSLN